MAEFQDEPVPAFWSIPELIYEGKYRLVREIGCGSFGVIYLGTDTSNGEQVAVKLESVKAKYPQLEYEGSVYKILQGGEGIPRFRWYGQEKGHHALVMELLGPSLDNLFDLCGGRFTLKTVLMLADQMIERVEYLHSKDFIHRDIKLNNFLMGVEENWNKLYMIDFGLAKRFRNRKTGQHIPYCEDKKMMGTARYASISAHLGREQSRRDDLESLGYNLIYFLNGNLPWMGITVENKKQRNEKIAERKMGITADTLCDGHPPEFKMYFNYCRGLEFGQLPDYTYLRELFRNLSRTLNYEYDFKFDWINLEQNVDLGNADLQLTEKNEFQPQA